MDGAVLATLFLTGFCALSSSFPNAYYFIEEEMTWDDAENYCNSKYIAMAQIQNVEDAAAMSNTPTGGYTDKAWIGLFATLEWTWVDGKPVTYSNNLTSEPNMDEVCAAMNSVGMWTAASCSAKKPFVCHDGGATYYLNRSKSTWKDANTSCEVKGDVLVTISNSSINSQVRSLYSSKGGQWIGLYSRKLWYRTESGEINEFMNWQNGQPDNLNGSDNCAAVVLTDGSWTDEQCDAKYPFFCSGVYEARKTVVRLKIHSSKNMEDPAHSADLLQQLSAALAEQGLTDFQLTWKKLPEKIQLNESSTRCLMTL